MMTGDRQSFVGFYTGTRLKEWIQQQADREGISVNAWCHNHFIDLSGIPEQKSQARPSDLDTHGRS